MRALVVGLLVAACQPNFKPQECFESRECNYQAAGVCRPGPSGTSWCTYPSDCPQGWSWSILASDELAESCVDFPDAGPDATLPLNPGEVIWASRIGSSSQDVATAVVYDSLGDLIVAGRTGGPFDFGSGPIDGPFVAKFSGDGVHIWSRPYPNEVRAMTLMRDDDLVVLGQPGSDCLARLDGADGTKMWSLASACPVGSIGADVAFVPQTPAEGDIVVVGDFASTYDFGGTSRTAAGSRDLFIAWYSSNNDRPVVRVQRYGKANGHVWGRGVCSDSIGRIAVTGDYGRWPVDFGGGEIDPYPGTDVAFLAGYSPAGVHRWSHAFLPGFTFNFGEACAGDSLGNVVLAGAFGETINVNGLSRTSVGGFDVLLARFSEGGAVSWANTYGGTAEDGRDSFIDSATGPRVATMSDGAAAVTGLYHGPAVFGSEALPGDGTTFESFAGLVSTSGSSAWVRAIRRSRTFDVATYQSRVAVVGAVGGDPEIERLAGVENGGDDLLIVVFQQ